MNNNENKKIYFEIMRVIACALVIFNHLPGYLLFTIPGGSKQFLYMCLTMITRFNVPLFFMISGALLFQKNEDFLCVLRKRFSRIVALLIVFDLLLVLITKINSLSSGSEYNISIIDLLVGILKNTIPGSEPYWYLFSYLGILFILPFLQRAAKNITRVEMISLLILHFLVSSLFPLINILCTYKGVDISVSIYGSFLVPFALEKPFFYTLLGYYLEYNVDVKKIKLPHICLLIISAVIGVVLSNVCTILDYRINGAYSQNYVQLFDYVTTIVAFILIKYIYIVKIEKRTGDRFNRIICFMGSMTLGIYMLDPCFKLIFYEKFNSWASSFLPTLIVSIGWIVISMVLGTICTAILKRIPVIKKII